MAREDPPSGIRPSLDDIFSRLRITDILRKQTGITRDDWTAIIKAIKIEKEIFKIEVTQKKKKLIFPPRISILINFRKKNGPQSKKKKKKKKKN